MALEACPHSISISPHLNSLLTSPPVPPHRYELSKLDLTHFRRNAMRNEMMAAATSGEVGVAIAPG